MAKNYRPPSAGMLPAAPGTYLVNAYFDGNEAEVVKSNIVGWQIGTERSLTPLVMDPRAANFDDLYVMHPDGRVESTDGSTWPDVDAWVDALQRALNSPPAPQDKNINGIRPSEPYEEAAQ